MDVVKNVVGFSYYWKCISRTGSPHVNDIVEKNLSFGHIKETCNENSSYSLILWFPDIKLHVMLQSL